MTDLALLAFALAIVAAVMTWLGRRRPPPYQPPPPGPARRYVAIPPPAPFDWSDDDDLAA